MTQLNYRLENAIRLQNFSLSAGDVYDELGLVKEMSDWQMCEITRIILEFFKGADVTNHNAETYCIQSYENLEELLGLAYTSSSSFAGLWACNVPVDYITNPIWYFTIDRYNRVLMAVKVNECDEDFYVIGTINPVQPITRAKYDHLYRMGFNQSKNGNQTANPDNYTTEEWKAFCEGWNAQESNNEIAKRVKF